MTTIRTYYLLTKPGIIMGNLITTACGFFFAAQGHPDPLLFFTTFLGLGLVIASACIFNNYIDRHIDQQMARTRNRPFARGLVSPLNGLAFASLLGLFGILLLAFYTNPLPTALAALGFFIYVALYSFWKPHYSLATLVGSLSGAFPPVIGYTAVSHRLDVPALLLFAVLVLWQMPHFFSIAMYRLADYKAAALPILPIRRGAHATKVHILLYILAFAIATLLLFPYAGYPYLVATSLLSFSWIILSIKGFTATNDPHWARQMFRLSLVVITVFSITLGSVSCGLP